MKSLVATALLISTAASAHLMPAQQGTLNVVHDAVFEVVAFPVSAFEGVDDDGDGRLSDAEVATHEQQLTQAVSRHYRLFDGDVAGALELVLVRAEHDERSDDSTAGSTTLIAMLKTRFASPPRHLRLETTLLGAGHQLTIKATRGAETEAAVLTPMKTTHAFFRAPLDVFRDSISTGVSHIVFGFDHLLFLLTIVVAVRGWRSWLSVLTGFTVAHSLTLTAALMGWGSVPGRFVEPAIAASIVMMAALNLRTSNTGAKHRVAIVFACGLLHGLGFASSMSNMGLDGAHRVLSLLGFNVGIELGQAAFVLAVLGLGAVARLGGDGLGRRLLPAMSVSACVIGAVWFVERIVTG